MKPLLIALISTTALCIAKPAHASHRHHHPFHRHHQAESTSKHYRHHARRHGVRYARHGSGSSRDHHAASSGSSIKTVETAAGTIRVAAKYAERFVGFINALVESGYKPKEIGCLSGGHMAHSKHHWGGACDIDQTARNRTAAAMYHVTVLAHRFNLTDGCEWRDRDCGHVEVPTAALASRWHHVRYAHAHHHHHVRYASS
jgi:hypothetical protein